MRLIFSNCQRINPERDGIDFLFFYRIDDDPAVHRIHTVSRHPLAWSIKQEELIAHSKQVFFSLIEQIKWDWPVYKELPAEDKEYFEGNNFGKITEIQLDWNGYVLELEN